MEALRYTRPILHKVARQVGKPLVTIPFKKPYLPFARLFQLSCRVSNNMASKKETVDSDAIPKPFPVMPCSAAVKYGGVVYLSGNIGLDPKTNTIVEGPIENRMVRRATSPRFVEILLMIQTEANYGDHHQCIEGFWVRRCQHRPHK